MRRFEAVIFDFGGVITASPFEAFNVLEEERGLPRDFVRTVNATNPHDNAWAKFERAEIDGRMFDVLFEAEAEALGHSLEGRAVLDGPLRVRVGWYWDGRGARTHPEHRPWMVDRIISPWAGVAAGIGRFLLGGWPSMWLALRSMMRGDPAGAYGFFLVMGLLVVLLTGLVMLPGVRRHVARQRWARSFPGEPVPDMIASRRKPTSA